MHIHSIVGVEIGIAIGIGIVRFWVPAAIAHFDFDSDPDFDSDFSTQYDLCNLTSEKL